MENLIEMVKEHLSLLCEKTTNRCVGSSGNLSATNYFKRQLENNDWLVEEQEFEAFDWESELACIETGDIKFKAQSSPYSEPCELEANTAIVSTIEEIENTDIKDKILIVKGDLTSEQLMPKNFVFYNPDHHKKIIFLFENSGAKALIFIVGKSGFCEGGEYPFPIIEDGDFMIPSVFISEEEGEKLLANNSGKLKLTSKTNKRPSKGYNIIGRKGKTNAKKITITAHIDAKKCSPGAIDNAAGVVTMLILSEMLKDYNGTCQVELVAFNGEDYYSAPGQMTYIEKKQGDFNDIALNINIDGVGLNKGRTSYSLMELQNEKADMVKHIFNQFPGLVEGEPWVQGDHSIFLQFGVPAVAISSEWLLENLQSQQITHTENDNLSLVDNEKILELSSAIASLIHEFSHYS